MTPTSKAQKLEELFIELEPIRAELNALLYGADNKLRWDTTPEEDARIDELAAQSDEIARRITTTTASREPFGFVCKACGDPAPVGIGYVADGADAAARSEGLTACECGYSTTDTEEEPMSTNEKSPAGATNTNEGKSFAEERSTASYINALLDDKAFLKSYIAVLQSQLWQAQNVVGGAEPRVILAYFGTGTGTPKFLARTAQRWQDHPEHGWEIVAHIDAAGHIRQGGER